MRVFVNVKNQQGIQGLGKKVSKEKKRKEKILLFPLKKASNEVPCHMWFQNPYRKVAPK